MKLFCPRISRHATVALLVHALALVLVGALMIPLALYFLRRPRATQAPMWQLYTAAAGLTLAVITGALIAILSTVRLFRPFAGSVAPEFARSLTSLFIAEAIIVGIFGGMFLDGGETQGRMLLLALALNFAVVGFLGRLPAQAQSAPEETAPIQHPRAPSGGTGT